MAGIRQSIGVILIITASSGCISAMTAYGSCALEQALIWPHPVEFMLYFQNFKSPAGTV
jgi:hypothetical protein